MNSMDKYGILGIKHTMPMFGEWQVFIESGDKLIHVPDQGYGEPDELSESSAEDVKRYLELYERNRMSFFLPHGPKEGGGLDFLNDWENQICLLTAPTRVGKSCHGNMFSLLRTMDCDPNWHCFQHHGIHHHEYRGRRRLVISSYEWINVQELWEEYIKWIPRDQLGKRLPDWGKFPDEIGAAKPIDLKQGKVSKVKLKDGTEILFRCDTQGQGPFEGQRFDEGHFDEQRHREKFIGYLRGTSNTSGLCQNCHTLTGHVVDGRVDTGAGGWIKRELYDGKYTFGKTIGRYKLDIATTPDVIISREQKAELKDQWVTQPERNKDVDTLRKAQARYHGGWESGSGLVIADYQPQHHQVPSSVLNLEKPIFKDATKYRGIDHGLSRPCACIWGMVLPWGDIVLYREYFEPGKSIPFHAKKIVEMSGNSRQKVDDFFDSDIEEAFDSYTEVQSNEIYADSVLDSRSFASPGQESSRTIGQLYNAYGMECTPAKGHRNEKLVPIMEAYFALDPQRMHLMQQLHTRGHVNEDVYRVWLKSRDGEIKNAPLLYLSDSLSKTPEELTTWALNPSTGLPKSENDHIAGGALKYLLAQDPCYYGSMWRDEPTITRTDRNWDAEAPEVIKSENKYTSY